MRIVINVKGREAESYAAEATLSKHGQPLFGWGKTPAEAVGALVFQGRSRLNIEINVEPYRPGSDWVPGGGY